MSVTKEIKRPNVMGYHLSNSNWIHLLAEGRLVNLAAGDGHPVEIMDMSFALQALSARYILENGNRLEPQVYPIPTELDEKVGLLLFKSKNVSIASLTEEQNFYINHWEI